MQYVKFEYFHKDVKHIKNDLALRCFFSFLLLVVFAFQFVLILFKIPKGMLSLMEIVFSSVTLLGSLIILISNSSYIFKNFRIISVIKIKGKCVSSVPSLMKANTKGFLRLYSVTCSVLSLATTLILIASITYSILQAAFLSTTSFYLPLLLLICVSGYNSIYQIKYELKTNEVCQKQQPLY